MNTFTTCLQAFTSKHTVKRERVVWTTCIFLATFLFFTTSPKAQLVRSAAGSTVASILPARDVFRVDLGGGTTAGANGSFGGLRREINWDGVPDAFSAPNNLPANFFNVNSPRGVVFSTPGTGFQVSANAGVTPIEFGNIDPGYPILFAPFSPQKLFTSLGSNITDIQFFVPGTTTPALTRGFGAVFSDVDLPNVTSIQLFDRNNNTLGTYFVPATAGNETFSFLGISYPAAVISRVRITSGNAALGTGVMESLPTRDLVVMDDFLYGEPAAPPAPCVAPTLLNNSTIVLDADCSGQGGLITLIPTSGTAPFLYSINGGATYVSGPATGYSFQNLTAGTYQLRLKDANGCESAILTKEVRRYYGGPLFKNDGTIVLDASCGANDGNISIIPTCGAAPFMYSIDGGVTYVEGPATGYTFQNLAPGTYQLRLKDAYGTESAIVTRQVRPDFYGPCATVTAAGPGARTAQSKDASATLRAYPNPSRGRFQVQVGRINAPRVQLQVVDARGTVLQSRMVNAQESSVVDIDLSGKAKGLYLIRVLSDKGTQQTKVLLQ